MYCWLSDDSMKNHKPHGVEEEKMTACLDGSVMIQLRAWNSTGEGGDNDCVDNSVIIQVGALNGTVREGDVFVFMVQ